MEQWDLCIRTAPTVDYAAGPKKSRGKSSGEGQVGTIVHTGVHAEGPMDTVTVEVEPVDEATGGLMGTMHGVSGGEGQQRLVPTI